MMASQLIGYLGFVDWIWDLPWGCFGQFGHYGGPLMVFGFLMCVAFGKNEEAKRRPILVAIFSDWWCP
jgi:hypothetical protein